MHFKLKGIKFNVEEVFIITVIVIVLSPIARSYLENYVVCFCFIAFHECAHILVASIFNIEVSQINIKLCGVNAILCEKQSLNPKWIIIYLAGPISNIFLAVVFKDIKLVRDVNIGLSFINLFPVYPLDGYNILKIMLSYYKLKKDVKRSLKIVAEKMRSIFGTAIF